MSETTPAAPKGVMLPGVAGVAIFLLVLTLLNVFAALSGRFGASAVKFGVLALCTILVAGLTCDCAGGMPAAFGELLLCVQPRASTAFGGAGILYAAVLSLSGAA